MIIWCNTIFREEATRQLRAGMKGHTITVPAGATAAVLVEGAPDPALLEADIAFGQPNVGQLLEPSRVRWVHLSSAGYSRYERADLQAALQSRGVPVTTSSDVFAESCSQHLLAMMLAQARQLPYSLIDQLTNRGWAYDERCCCSASARSRAGSWICWRPSRWTSRPSGGTRQAMKTCA